MFSAKNWIRPAFYQSESSLLRKHIYPVYWLDGKFHHQQCGQRLLFFGERLLLFGERRLFSTAGSRLAGWASTSSTRWKKAAAPKRSLVSGGWLAALLLLPPGGRRLLPLKEDGRLQSCRFEGLDAWMPGGLYPGVLEAGWLACWLTGLDWIGCEWLLDRRKWWDWRTPCVLTRSTL